MGGFLRFRFRRSNRASLLKARVSSLIHSDFIDIRRTHRGNMNPRFLC